jgi:hypothetical protein
MLPVYPWILLISKESFFIPSIAMVSHLVTVCAQANEIVSSMFFCLFPRNNVRSLKREWYATASTAMPCL